MAGHRVPGVALAWLVGALAAAAATAAVSGPSTWVQASFADFSAGDLEGVSVTRDGQVRLAPLLELVRDSFPPPPDRRAGGGGEPQTEAAAAETTPYVWAIDRAADGTWYAAVGSEGAVYRARPGQPPEWLFSVGSVHALLVGPDDHVYVSVSPSGAVYRVPPDYVGGEPPRWFEPNERYAWALAFGPEGRLYLGTGLEGRIYSVDREGNGEVFYDSSEAHVTALAVDDRGNLLAGTDGSGHVYRISPDGEVFVLFDAPLRQITGIVASERGVFVAAMDEAAGGGASSGEPASSGGGTTQSAAPELNGAVYLIRPDGYTEQLWSSDKETAHSLVARADGVVVGTGPEGRMYHLGMGSEMTILQRVEAAQVTGLRPDGDELLVATSNLGKIYRLGREFRSRGEIVSQVKDTGTTSSWGRIRWRARTPPGTSLRLYTRIGNTESPDDTWSDWSGPYEDAEGTVVSSEAARFVQWKAELASQSAEQTPVLQWVEIVYVQRNLRPVIGDFTVHPGGVVYRQTSSFEDTLPFGQLPAALERELARTQGREPAGSSGSGTSFLGRPFFVPGQRMFTWQASDPNGDGLVYSLDYRGEDESTWKPIVSKLLQTQHTWDTATVADGLYVVRVVASDAPSNPAGDALEERRSSEPFLVDNTPPSVGALRATVGEAGVRVTGQATDEVGLIRQIEYAVDGGPWQTVLPADGLADSRAEDVDFAVTGLGAGEHTIIVRVTDTAFNRGAGKAVVTVR